MLQVKDGRKQDVDTRGGREEVEEEGETQREEETQGQRELETEATVK